ncbi:hypothetical protein GCM10007962_29670 [Yeosuana aromativorans]|uniref:Secretion system C-terminal sorting domain-containing protein n=1 Tax=Yeosuana aromativorans TaxID=288019 RepID=A0A8J3BS71_9FLAO|nr:M64 family metallopeptidase [Yeosuana aromativorans]GGK33374.1 hypothetical protein GCM10007962_29670 [Yeosuana aromativorans]
MKQSLFLILSILNIQLAFSQAFTVESIKYSGDNNKRINLVILSEGYQSSEFNKFTTDATNFMNSMFSQTPYSEYANYFNVYIIKVPSNESGADHPGTATDVVEPTSPITNVDTYFNSSYDTGGYHRLLYSFNTSTISTVLANNFQLYDIAIVLVNSSEYGGSGGQFAFASTGMSASEIAVHEIGHSFANLKDEYFQGDEYLAEGINLTQETNPSLVKWKNWIGVNGINIYQLSGSVNAKTWYRPHQTCKMRYLGYPFCSVCTEGVIEKIHSLVSPIDSYTPISSSITNPSFLIDFQLNLIETIPNTLQSKWTLNGADFANNLDHLSVLKTDLNAGINNLTAVVTDTTPLLRIDNHETIHAYTVSWTIDNSALGVHEINSQVNDIKITVYPNPTQDIVNLKFDSSLNTNLRVDIVSMDGKKIATKTISSSYTSKIDMQSFSNGIYIAKFYSNNVLIATKKLVKN